MERQGDKSKHAAGDTRIQARDIVRRETPNRLNRRRREMRTAAASRIDKIFSGKWNENSPDELKLHFAAQKVLRIYNFSNDEIKKMTIKEAYKVAARLIASDLLVSEFYDADGQLTEFSEKYYPEVDAEDYVVIAGQWSYTKGVLEKRLRDSGWKENNDEQLGMDLNTDQDGDVVAEYARWFGKKSILAIPFSISFESYSININYEDDFIEPYGGGEYTSRLVFVPREGSELS